VQAQPAWPPLNTEKPNEICRDGGGLVDLWESSPARIEDNDSHTEEIIDGLFPHDPLLCCGKSNSDFDTQSHEEWRGQLRKLSLILPSPMTARRGYTQEGKRSPHALSITGPRRFLVIEFDLGSVDDHVALFLYLAETQGPLALVVHSGNKSLHGWFAYHGQTEERLRRFMERVVSLGADPATWTRSQFCPHFRMAHARLSRKSLTPSATMMAGRRWERSFLRFFGTWNLQFRNR
jgi:hypothetical protein